MNKLFIRITFIFLCFTLLSISCNTSLEKTKPITENITESVYASGIIKTKNQYQVFSTVSGIISKIYVTENDLVNVGSPLMQVTDKATRLNRENARLAASYADIGVNREKLTDAKNNITLALTKYKNDSLLFKRQQNLWSQGIGSKVELEQRELAWQNSKTALESSRIKYNDLQRQLQFNAEQSRNNLAISDYREGDLTVKSEIKGKIYSLFKEQGEMVNPQTALAIIGDASSFLLELQVDEYDIVKIKLGQKVLVSMDSYKSEVFEATVTKVNPIMNDRTKTFLVEALFVKQPPLLYPNLSIEANIVIQTKENALIIPRRYLVNDSMVLVEKDKKQRVVTGLKDYQKVEIISGLTTNDVIYKPQ